MAEAARVEDGVVADFISAALEASRKTRFELAYEDVKQESEPAKKPRENAQQAEKK